MAAARGENLTRQMLSFSRTLPLDATVIGLADAVPALRDVLAGSLNVNIELTDRRAERPPGRSVSTNRSLSWRWSISPSTRATPCRTADACRFRRTMSSCMPGEIPGGPTGEVVALNIADTGSGISPELLPRVVEPFFTTKDPDKGTGLGLTQVYGFARQSGGTVQITSEVGRGTKVTIYLPRSRSTVAASSPEDTTQYLAVGHQTVLVVEDNPDVRNVAVSLLEQLGYRTIAVEIVSCRARCPVVAAGRESCLQRRRVAGPHRRPGARAGDRRTVSSSSGGADNGICEGLRHGARIPGAAQTVSVARSRPRHPRRAQFVPGTPAGSHKLTAFGLARSQRSQVPDRLRRA